MENILRAESNAGGEVLENILFIDTIRRSLSASVGWTLFVVDAQDENTPDAPRYRAHHKEQRKRDADEHTQYPS